MLVSDFLFNVDKLYIQMENIALKRKFGKSDWC